ncbi:MAG: helix-turn-helix transcriptional regulator [Alphaproteobacteria bacterium]|nr:helix-turn-helix transcriptional regulator [Alphaproteobacteria bacterium]
MIEQTPSARLAALIVTHFGPGAGVPFRTLARAAGKSEETIRHYVDGTTSPTLDTAERIIAALVKAGCSDARRRVFGNVDADGQGPRGADTCLWVDSNGALHAAPYGHERLVLDVLDAKSGGWADWAGYAVRAMGWVQITLSADGHLLVKLSAQRAKAQAVARASAWILQPREMLAGIEILILDGDRLTSHQCDTRAGAVRQLEAAIAMPPAGRMVIDADRQPLAVAGTDDAMSAALRTWDGTLTGAEVIARAVAASGGANRSGLYRLGPRGFVCAGVGGALPISGEIVGKPVKINGDPDYWDMVDAHLLATLAEGPTLNTIEVRARGDRGVYQRLALPVMADGAPAVWATSRITIHPQRVVIQ